MPPGHCVRARDLFDRFDARRKGWLSGPELRLLVKALLPDASEGDARYFHSMIDENGDEQVTYEEFMRAAQACMRDASSAKDTAAPDIQAALRGVAQYMRDNR
ncbi:uncharacterized protein HaLaN_28313, partial [Haematococcus lacustris]